MLSKWYWNYRIKDGTVRACNTHGGRESPTEVEFLESAAQVEFCARRNEYTYSHGNYLCICLGVQLKYKLKHTWTRTAAAWSFRARLIAGQYSSATFVSPSKKSSARVPIIFFIYFLTLPTSQIAYLAIRKSGSVCTRTCTHSFRGKA
jgi:hypothetical protein